MTPNKQPIEKVFADPTGAVQLHHVFFTLQGEGPFSGERSVFVRLAGCNLQCPGCDTDYTSSRELVSPEEVARRVRHELSEREISGGTLVVITGGEPMRQDIAKLVFVLLQYGHRVQIETNGVLPPSPELELLLKHEPNLFLVLSPKTSRINGVTAVCAMAFKYVLRAGEINEDDGLPTRALGHKATPQVARPPHGWNKPVYINPMDEQNEALNTLNTMECARSALEHGHKLGLQIHKFLNLE